uniref:Phosphatidylinositol-3-phosphatase SAC1 n=1 Tax=Piliocolobus tephrosceles TaxID=591936 RepID=A0A8C9HIC2_9PRIM
MNKLRNLYGNISITNLINKNYGEKYLGQCFEKCLKGCNVEHNFTWFDFNVELNKLNIGTLHNSLKTVMDDLNNFEYFYFSISNNVTNNLFYGDSFPSWSTIKTQNYQKGIFRVNCIDCLDRTNVFQSLLAKCVLYLQLKKININLYEQKKFPFYVFKNYYDEILYRKIWINNANAISIIYSGAGALKNDITQNGKRTINGIIQDLCHIIQRYINNNFIDGYNNDCINLVINESVNYSNTFHLHKNKYNQLAKVLFEFLIIFSTSVCTNPVQKLLKGIYLFSHNISYSMISKSIHYVMLFLRSNFPRILLSYQQPKYLFMMSTLAKASGIISTSFVVLIFFFIYVFIQKRRVISSPKLATS